MKTVVTFTTIPTRLEDDSNKGIRICIDSLLSQSVDNYEIHFNIPGTFKSTGEPYVIPTWLNELEQKESKLKVFTDLEDIGPSTKLLYTVDRLENDEDIIIVVDDDIVYNIELVEAHIQNQINHPEAVVGYDGMRSKDNHFGDIRDHYHTGTRRTSRVDILQHYKSVSYKKRYFEEDFKEFVKENFTWEDDLLLSAYFAFKKRDRIVTFHESDPELSLEEWHTRGGVWTFPFEQHTSHRRQEGCNVYRDDKEKGKVFITNENLNLYKFIDNGYR